MSFMKSKIAPAGETVSQHANKEASLWLVGVHTAIPEAQKKQHRGNAIRTRKYTPLTFIPRNLWEQFHRLANVFFLFMATIAFIPQTQALKPETAVAPLFTVLLITALRDYYEDSKRGNFDTQTNARKTRVLRNGKFVEIEWKDVVVGDIVRVVNGEGVPADLFLLRLGLADRKIDVNSDPKVLAKQRTTANPYAIVIDGGTLHYVLQSEQLRHLFVLLSAGAAAVVCCRTAPLQKAVVVSLVRNQLQAITMAIGDGANDVSMLKEANIGVGISGKEGMQAVLASDFAIAKFMYLQRLLLVHGRYSYNRIARLVLYCFYKNYVYVLANFYFGFYCAASAQTIYENRYIMLYNVVFTSVPLLLVSMTEQDVSPEGSMKYPQLYRDSQRNALFQHYIFWLHILDAVYQSLVVYFFAIWANGPQHHGISNGVLETGTTMYTSVVLVVNIKLLIDCQHWNRWVVVSVGVSVFLYFVFVLLYHGILPDINPIYFGFYNVASTATFWTSVFLIIVVALLPSFVTRCILVTIRPSAAQIVRERELTKAGRVSAESHELQVHNDPELGPVASLQNSRHASIAL